MGTISHRCAYFGEAEDLQYCEQLANLCVLTLYDKTSKACQILSQIQKYVFNMFFFFFFFSFCLDLIFFFFVELTYIFLVFFLLFFLSHNPKSSNRPTVTGFTGWKQTIPYLQFDAIGTAGECRFFQKKLC